jgi:Transglutaminase-like superfamily
MAPRLVSFFRLPFSDQALLIRATLAVVNAKLATRTLPLPKARAIVTRQQRLGWTGVPVRADRIVWAVETASQAIPGMKNCLVQAVAAEAMLIQAGYPCELRVGVAKKGPDELIAHAWVESEGRVVIGEFELDRYTPLKAPRLQSGTPPTHL